MGLMVLLFIQMRLMGDRRIQFCRTKGEKMKRHFECNNVNCMAHNGDGCIWAYEDNVDVNNKKVCKHIKELLKPEEK